jgi:hypothetical protein
MLAELFMLKLEAIARSSNNQGGTSSASRFVPVKIPTLAAKNSPTPTTKNG